VPAPPKWEPSQGCLNCYIAVCNQIGGSKPPPYNVVDILLVADEFDLW